MTQDLADPAADIRSEIAARSGLPDPLNKIWFHKTSSAVIDGDRCVRCGSCIAACPSQSIGIAEDGLPTLIRMCTGCSRCWDFCPLAGMRTERLWRLSDGEAAVESELGTVRAAYSARALDPAPGVQDGGVVTALLEELLRQDEIDGVLLTKPVAPFKAASFIARTVAEVREAAGSIYDQTLPLALLEPQAVPPGLRLAFVGTPCQVNGLRALQRYGWKYRRNVAAQVKLAIALCCSRSFDQRRLMIRLVARGIDPALVAKVSVSEASLRVHDGEGKLLLEAPVKEFWDVALRGCDECADFSGRLGDLSVGSVGSPSGSTTVLVRSEAGAKAWQLGQHRLAIGDPPDLERVARLERRNRGRAEKNLKREFDPDDQLWISYEDHLESYAGTDRGPVPSPGYRSHHYLISC